MSKKVSVSAVLLATIFLSTKSIWAKLIYLDAANPISVLLYRSIIALPFFLIPLLKINWHNINKIQVMKYGAMGAIIYLISSLADFCGLLFISASLERAVLFTFPIYVLLLSPDKTKISRPMIILSLLTVIGLIIMFNPVVTEDYMDLFIGGGLVLLSSFFWAIFIVYSKRVIPIIGATLFTSIYMCISTLILLLISIVNSDNFLMIGLYDNSTLIYLICLAFLCSILPSYLLSYGVKSISASQTAIISSVGPVMTLILDVIVLNHSLLINEIVGTIIVTISITCLTRLKQ